MMNCGELANALVPHVLKAGQAIMVHYRQGCVVSTKDGGSPVTAADEDAEAVLLDALSAIAPGVTVIAEEMMEGKSATNPGSQFFLVDALDGTREFIDGRDEFTINIGLIRDQVPCFRYRLRTSPVAALRDQRIGYGACRIGAARRRRRRPHADRLSPIAGAAVCRRCCAHHFGKPISP